MQQTMILPKNEKIENTSKLMPKGLHQKIIAVMDEVGYLEKDVQIKFNRTNYKAISETKVTSTVRKSLIKHHLTFIPIHQEVTHRGDITQLEVTYRLTDADSGEFIDVVSAGEGADTQDKGIGKASTYAYKYALLRTFAIATGEDPDMISSDEFSEKQKQYQQQNSRTKVINEINNLYGQLMNRGYDMRYLTTTAMNCVGRQFQTLDELNMNELYNVKSTFSSLG